MARGDWTLAHAGVLAASMADAVARLPQRPLEVDAGGVTRLDTAGALLLLRALRSTGIGFDRHRITGLDEADAALLRLVAERVSGVEQLRRLRSAGCDELQGNLLSPAVPADQIASSTRF